MLEEETMESGMDYEEPTVPPAKAPATVRIGSGRADSTFFEFIVDAYTEDAVELPEGLDNLLRAIGQ